MTSQTVAATTSAPTSAPQTTKSGRGIVKDVPAQEFIIAYAAHLKHLSKFQVPKWADIVKTGIAKELPPSNPDWYYIRAASMARKIYLRGGRGIGIGSFRKIYGSKKRYGTAPSHFTLSSGSVARHILHDLEKVKVVEKDPKGGRRLTSSGRRDLDRIAGQIKVVVKSM